MDQLVRLIALTCLRCGTRLPAEPGQVAWVCQQCGQGLLLDDEQGLAALVVQYAADVPVGAVGRPFWVCDGRISLARQAHRRDTRAEEESARFWSSVRRFFIPAWDCTLEELLTQANAFLLSPPILVSGAACPFRPVTLALEDIRPAVDFIVTAVEAGRKDYLRQIDISAELGPPALWILT